MDSNTSERRVKSADDANQPPVAIIAYAGSELESSVQERFNLIRSRILQVISRLNEEDIDPSDAKELIKNLCLRLNDEAISRLLQSAEGKSMIIADLKNVAEALPGANQLPRDEKPKQDAIEEVSS